MARSLRAASEDLETSRDAAPQCRGNEGGGDRTKPGALRRTACLGCRSTFPHLMWPRPEPTSRCLLEGAHCRKRFSMLKKETDSRSGGAPATKARATPPFAVATLPALCRTAVGTGWVHATADSVGLLGVPRVSVRSGCTSALDMMSTKRRSSAWTAQLVDVLSIFGTFTCLIVREPGVRCSSSWTIAWHAPGSHARSQA